MVVIVATPAKTATKPPLAATAAAAGASYQHPANIPILYTAAPGSSAAQSATRHLLRIFAANYKMPPKRPPPAEVLGRPQGRFPPPRDVLDRPSRTWPTAAPPRAQSIRDVFEELNYPCEATLKTALKERPVHSMY